MIRLPCLCVSQRRLSRHPALTALGVSFIRIIKVIDFADDVLSSTLLIRRKCSSDISSSDLIANAI